MRVEALMMRIYAAASTLAGMLIIAYAFVDKYRLGKSVADPERLMIGMFLLLLSMQTYTLYYVMRHIRRP
jgi:hypothetical protein